MDAFVTASLTVCIGAMAVVGSIQDGIYGDISTLTAKAVLDLIMLWVKNETLYLFLEVMSVAASIVYMVFILRIYSGSVCQGCLRIRKLCFLIRKSSRFACRLRYTAHYFDFRQKLRQ